MNLSAKLFGFAVWWPYNIVLFFLVILMLFLLLCYSFLLTSLEYHSFYLIGIISSNTLWLCSELVQKILDSRYFIFFVAVFRSLHLRRTSWYYRYRLGWSSKPLSTYSSALQYCGGNTWYGLRSSTIFYSLTCATAKDSLRVLIIAVIYRMCFFAQRASCSFFYCSVVVYRAVVIATIFFTCIRIQERAFL